jgi:hypothetical protein
VSTCSRLPQRLETRRSPAALAFDSVALLLLACAPKLFNDRQTKAGASTHARVDYARIWSWPYLHSSIVTGTEMVSRFN